MMMSTPMSQLAPGFLLGNFDVLLNQQLCNASNIKVVVNCGSTRCFLEFLNSQQPVLSSDIIVLSLDPGTSTGEEAYTQFHQLFNRILQNYLAFFYEYNANVRYYINSNLNNAKLSFESPIINGNPLKSLFNINRLLKLITNVNTGAGVVFLSEHFGHQHHSNSLIYALAILFLMDRYNYNFEASSRFLSTITLSGLDQSNSLNPFLGPQLFNSQYYDDVLLIDSLKKFYQENSKIKHHENNIMTQNQKLKRAIDTVEPVPAYTTMKRVAWNVR